MSKNNSFYGISKILSLISRDGARVHFSGVGGASMSSLFCLSHYFGISVSGSDKRDSALLSSLISRGADIVIGEREKLPDGVCLLVYSLAIGEDDRELMLAARQEIPTVSRAEYMGALLECYRERIAVSGSHGKSTVTAMIYSILREGGKNPTALSGASLGIGEGNFAVGGLQSVVYEACEYKDSFLLMPADIGVFLNLELDHVDYFKNFGEICDSFSKAIIKCGRAVINTDDRALRNLADLRPDSIKVGSVGDEDYTFRVIKNEPRKLSFSLRARGGEPIEFTLPLMGEFNVKNAAVAAAVGLELGILPSVIVRALASFHGIGGRLENIGSLWGAPVYRDYAHHPTEILAGIRAVRSAVGGKVAVVFVPHTYSRTRAFLSELAEALRTADLAVVTEITAARESDSTVSGADLAEAAGAKFAPSSDEVIPLLCEGYSAYMIMGAGDCDSVIDSLTRRGLLCATC